MSKGQTNKKTKGARKILFSKQEIKALSDILAKPHWGRRKMKDAFIIKYGRTPADVDAYIRDNGKRKGSTTSAQITESTIDLRDTVKKEKATHLASRGVFTLYRTGNEIRIAGFKSFKMEGGSLIIETE